MKQGVSYCKSMLYHQYTETTQIPLAPQTTLISSYLCIPINKRKNSSGRTDYALIQRNIDDGQCPIFKFTQSPIRR